MAEKTIMLVCSAGMSTSMLVQRMKKAAEADGLDVDVFATAAADADNKLASEPVSVLMLGPQVRFMESQFAAKVAGTNIPMAIIDMRAYGMMDGEKVLRQALALIDEKASSK